MSKFSYNKNCYRELLKLKVSEDKILSSAEESELRKYSGLLDATLDWEMKEEYIDLLEKLISEKINSSQFYFEFLEFYNSTLDIPDILEANFVLLSLPEKAEKFCDLICDIRGLCVSYEDVFEPFLSNEEYDSDCLKFGNDMEEIYFKIQNLLNKE